MVRRMRYLFTYDISDDTRRARLAQTLLDYGDRVQKSVFEADLTQADLTRIFRRLKPLINETADSLRIYPVCQECLEKLIVIGLDRPLIDEDLVII